VVPHVFEDVALVGGGHSDDLGHVERGAATETDHAVGAVRLEGGGTVHDLAAGRVAEHARKHRHVQPREVGAELGQHRQCAQRAVGHDQGALAAGGQQVRAHQFARTGTELDGGGKGEGMDAHGGSGWIR
jgi:hypothetical protein